jgi:nucleoside-diphosphate-sugar epimerase
MTGKILITGSTGFIGRRLKSFLAGTGHAIEEFNTAQGDIASARISFRDIRHVFHLAGKSFVPDSWKHPEEFRWVNVEGTRNVLEFSKANGASVTFVSSYIYGIPVYLPVNEAHPVNPSNPYADSKKRAEDLCLEYNGKFGIPLSIIRPFNIYGPGQPSHFLIPEIIRQLDDPQRPEIVLQDLAPRRDYIYLDDFVSAMLALFEKGCDGIYNVGAGYSLSVEEIAGTIFNVAQKQKPLRSAGVVRKNEIPDVVADITRIRLHTGWEPRFSFEQGIACVISR